MVAETIFRGSFVCLRANCAFNIARKSISLFFENIAESGKRLDCTNNSNNNNKIPFESEHGMETVRLISIFILNKNVKSTKQKKIILSLKASEKAHTFTSIRPIDPFALKMSRVQCSFKIEKKKKFGRRKEQKK